MWSIVANKWYRCLLYGLRIISNIFVFRITSPNYSTKQMSPMCCLRDLGVTKLKTKVILNIQSALSLWYALPRQHRPNRIVILAGHKVPVKRRLHEQREQALAEHRLHEFHDLRTPKKQCVLASVFAIGSRPTTTGIENITKSEQIMFRSWTKMRKQYNV